MKILLIPSAILIPEKMRTSFGDLPAALFPLGNKPMIVRLCEQYLNHVDEIFLVVHAKKEKIYEYVKASSIPVKVIELDEVKDLGYTIRYGLKKILERNSEIHYLYINFADSLLNESLNNYNGDFSYFEEMSLNPQWTYFKEIDGHLTSILDKENVKNEQSSDKDFNKMFVGVFGINDAKKFLECFDTCEGEDFTDSFYSALKKYSEYNSMKFFLTHNWIDVGHYEKYVRGQVKVATRYFNSIEIDEMRGILKKNSKNKEKFINEIIWYLKIPNQLQYLLPRIYDYSLDFDKPYVKMEFYGYRTMHEILLYSELNDSEWYEIFNKLKFAFNDMKSYQIHGRIEEIETALKEMYIEKVLRRLELLKKSDKFEIFFNQKFIVNGKLCHSINEIEKLLPDLVYRLVMKDAEKFFSIIHGDLCFSNILVEETHSFIRLVDPRGKFGSFDIYGDNRYDLAKLMHTLEGNYDCIIEDMFSLNVEGTQINYEILIDYSRVRKLFGKVFEDVFKNQIQSIRLIEATLFLSMIPLHADSLKRQFVMLATGAELFENVLKNLEE